MATLDRIIQMQNQGMSESDIVNGLKKEGISPREINDALSQAKVKNAVTQQDGTNEQQAQGNFQGMQQSIMPQQGQQGGGFPTGQQANSQQNQEAQQNIQQAPQQVQQQGNAQPRQPMTQEMQAPSQEQQMQAPQYGSQEQYNYPQGQENEQQQYDYGDYYTQNPQAYEQYGYYPQQGGYDTDTITEIAEQVVAEKFEEFEGKTGDLVTFKNLTEEKLNDLSDRLKRMENSIEKLQQAIIGKIGEFGESTAAIHNDLDNLHGTMSKLMNPLVDNYNELKKLNSGKS